MPLSPIFGPVGVVFLESNPRRLEQMALGMCVCDYECVKLGVAARLICCDLCLSETMKDSSRLRLTDKPALCPSVLSRASPSWRSCVSSCTRPPTPPSDTRLRKLWWNSPTAPTVSANVSCCWREAAWVQTTAGLSKQLQFNFPTLAEMMLCRVRQSCAWPCRFRSDSADMMGDFWRSWKHEDFQFCAPSFTWTKVKSVKNEREESRPDEG